MHVEGDLGRGRSPLKVVPWADPVVERIGFDPRSPYVELFWLPILGPSATWLLRRLAGGLERSPVGFLVDLDHTARSLGLGSAGGRHSPLRRAITRCARYGAARHLGEHALGVRRRLAPLPERHLRRLPQELREQHPRWSPASVASVGPEAGSHRDRAVLLATALTRTGTPPAELEHRLWAWGVHPALAHEAALRSAGGSCG